MRKGTQTDLAVKMAARLDHIRTAKRRWQMRAKRAMTMLDKLDKQERRLVKLLLPTSKEIVAIARPRAHALLAAPETLGPAIREAAQDAGLIPQDDLSIPGYLRRDGYRQASPITEHQLKLDADREEKRKARAAARAKARKSKRDAKLAGLDRKMPLTGKAALDYIKQA